jgi:hypothetical protein
MSISGNLVGSYSQIGKTFVIQDEEGNEVIAVVTDQEQIFTATDNDVREGMVYASNEGVSTGTKKIPAYVTAKGYRLVTAGSDFFVPHNDYDYTELQALFCAFNTTLDNSVSTEKVVIDDVVYNVNSTEALSTVVKDHDKGWIMFGITNESDNRYLIRYFMYKEIY